MKPVIFSIIFSFVLVLSSCTTVYTPTEVNAPLLIDKNEFVAGASYTTAGAGLQLAYSLTKNIAFIGSGSWMSAKENNGRDYQRYGELGAGYFKSFDKSKSSRFEVFFGTGFGEATSYDNDFNAQEKGNYYKLFLQPDISYSIGWIDLALAMRIVYLKYTSYSFTQNTEGIPYLPSAFGIEPVVMIRVGPPNFKIKYQTGFSALTENKDKPFGRSGIIVSFGAMFIF